jgi:hypothetical protein
MVDRAHRHAVRDNGFAAVTVTLDMSGIEELHVSQPTHRALGGIGKKYSLPKEPLVDPFAHDSLDVLTAQLLVDWVKEISVPLLAGFLVESDNELMRVRLFGYQGDTDDRHVHTWSDSEKPDQRKLSIHGDSQSDVVVGIRICALPLVAKVVVWTDLVIVRTCLGITRVRGHDREGGVEARDRPNAALSDEGETTAFEDEAVELFGCERVAVTPHQGFDVGNGRSPKSCIRRGVHHPRSIADVEIARKNI